MHLEDILKGKNIPGNAGDPFTPPLWYDPERFYRAQQIAKKCIFQLTLALHFSLLIGLSVINLLKPLVFTGNSDTPHKSLKRYMNTYLYLMKWYLVRLSFNKPESESFKALLRVRNMHVHIAKKMNSETTKELHFSQYDFALVQCGFMGAIVLFGKLFNIGLDNSQTEELIYFWKCIGHILGIYDEFNICQGDFPGTHDICSDINDKVVIPAVIEPPKDFYCMATAYVDGINLILPGKPISVKSHISYIFECMQLPCPYTKLSFCDKIRLNLVRFSFLLMRYCPGFNRVMNFCTLFVIKYQMKVPVDV